ncbi:alpha/beta fold hydrolase [Cognatilysobacter segetis]|uniref:alpha/beta fold hydrolase n=1 Tax=Cognatilysobacter segetis TaxID=2492394 RepID=UPI001060D6D9|nr:alpha/beta hydrolase [Lysobacter segetis]
MGKGRIAGTWLLASALWVTATAQAAEVPVPRTGYTLQADVQGDGPTTVIFESGFGQGGGVWKGVIAGLGADCRCITYARAGLGGSGSDGAAKTIDAHVADLDAVIETLAPGRTVVLVGHSYGGLLATEYARRHPERLQGLVLVDPATMGQRHAFMQADRARVQADDATLLSMLPPALAADYRVLIAQLDAPTAATPTVMPDVPVALLTSTHVAADPFVFEETAQGKALWKAQHATLFAAFARGTHRYVATGHNVHREAPGAVVQAVREVAGAREAAVDTARH